MKLFDRLKRAAAAAAALVLSTGCFSLPAAAADTPMTFRLTVDNDLFTVQELAESEQVVHGAMYIENYTGISSMRIVIANSDGIIIENGGFDFAGFGRMIFAYPDFANDILHSGELKKEKICICCSKCTELMRGGGTPGCVVRDHLYTDLYKQSKKREA